jgi:hypothetical protein
MSQPQKNGETPETVALSRADFTRLVKAHSAIVGVIDLLPDEDFGLKAMLELIAKELETTLAKAKEVENA